MAATDLEANALLDAIFRTAGGSYDVGLSTTLPADDGTGWTEPADADYARPEIHRNTTDWAAASGRQIETAVDLPWPQPASVDWNDVGFWLLFDHGTDDLRYYGRFSSLFDVPAGSTARLVTGELWIRVPDSTLTL